MNIKIVICFIIICFFPVASAGTTDAWTAKYSGFIKSGQSASFENYLIKPKIIDNSRAAISVYMSQALIETVDFNVNDFKKYGNIRITLLGIIGDYSWISVSKLENKDIYRPLTSRRLKWGEAYTIEDYTFNIDTFGSDSVNLIVSNKSVTQTIALSVGNLKDYGPFRISAREINSTGFIDLDFFTYKAAAINADISTDKNEYFPDEPVRVTVNISSDFPQNIAGIILESSVPVDIQPDNYSATGVSGAYSFHSQMTRFPANSSVSITAKIETRDYYNSPYTTTVSKDILVLPEVSIMKRPPLDPDDENVKVALYVYNAGLDKKSIHIHDSIPEELAAKELDWDIELGPKNSTNLTYYVAPQKPGLYFLPSAKAQWNGQSALSRRVKMTMHMPLISMTKTAVRANSQTDVKLVISNNGDRPAQVKVSDKMPQEYSLIGGDTAWSGNLEAGGSATISYSLKGGIEVLPAADATYRDMRGTIREAHSNPIEPKASDNIDKKEEASPLSSKPYEIASFMISSFIAMAGVIVGVAMVAYLLTRFKRRR